MKSFLNFFKSLWSKISPALNKSLQLIDTISHQALPVVEMIAALVPNQSVSEIVALYEKYGLANLDAYLALPVDDRGAALANAALQLLKKRFPQASTTELKTAVQAAVTKLKADGPAATA